MRKSKFNLTHLHSTTLDPGFLVPILCLPTLPNDTFRIGLSSFIRAQPMLAPLMHEVRMFTQYWFVPNRIIWDEWEDFITGGGDLSLTPPYPFVKSTAEDAKAGSLWDYLGFPLVEGVEVSALPFRAIAEIYNTRYRDEDLQEEISIDYGSNEDTNTSRKLLSPAFAKDYFTTSRPFTQRGGDIAVPVFDGIGGEGVTQARRINFRILACHHTDSQTGDRSATLSFCAPSFKGVQQALEQWFTDHIAAGDIDDFVATLPAYGTDHSFFSSARMQKHLFYSMSTNPKDQCKYYNGNDFTVGFSFFIFIDNTVDFEVKDNVVPHFETTPWGGTDVDCFPAIRYVKPLTEFFRFPFYTSAGTFWTSWKIDPRNDKTVAADWTKAACPGSFVYAYSNRSLYGFKVRDLRRASSLQIYAERSLKLGNRYEEFIQREFGIKPRDYRIQRPEYLGGGRGILNISEVLQTAESTDSGVGTMRGHGVASLAQRPIRFRCPEHGVLIGFLSIRPKSVYTQGIDREWLKRSRLDFFTPELANIGMQEVLQQELFATPDNAGEVFGYSERYQEYRYQKPLVTGEMRTNLNFWNMARLFANPPNLNAEFISMEFAVNDFKRPFQIQDNSAHAFVAMLKNHVRAFRPIPKRAKDILK